MQHQHQPPKTTPKTQDTHARMTISGCRTIVKPSEKVLELKRLLELWREKPLLKVRSCDIVPDSSNRGHTGLSIDHVHFIASSILKKGFRSRHNNVKVREKEQPHDIPVLCRGSKECPIANDSLQFWHESVARELRFPKIVINVENFFTSLGNGHFSQALNLFQHQQRSKFTGRPFVCSQQDKKLRQALDEGVEAIVLRQETPIEVRRRVATLLNDTHDYKWTVVTDPYADNYEEIDISPEHCYNERFTQFEAQAKVADSEALSALVQLELGIFSNDEEQPDEDLLDQAITEKLVSKL